MDQITWIRFEDLLASAIQTFSREVFFSPHLKLRPNYLVYFSLGSDAEVESSALINKKEIPYGLFKDCTLIEALAFFLKKIQAGVYLPSITFDFEKLHEKVFVFLLDPHLIEAFETQLNVSRLGVLIRRPIIATNDFKSWKALP